VYLYLGIDQIRQHTAAPNVEANFGKEEDVEAQQWEA